MCRLRCRIFEHSRTDYSRREPRTAPSAHFFQSEAPCSKILTNRIDATNLFPAFPERQRRVQLEGPQLDGTSEHRRVVFRQDLCWDRLLGLYGVQAFPEMMHSGQWNLVDPRLPLLCRSTANNPISRQNVPKNKRRRALTFIVLDLWICRSQPFQKRR